MVDVGRGAKISILAVKWGFPTKQQQECKMFPNNNHEKLVHLGASFLVGTPPPWCGNHGEGPKAREGSRGSTTAGHDLTQRLPSHFPRWIATKKHGRNLVFATKMVFPRTSQSRNLGSEFWCGHCLKVLFNPATGVAQRATNWNHRPSGSFPLALMSPAVPPPPGPCGEKKQQRNTLPSLRRTYLSFWPW